MDLWTLLPLLEGWIYHADTVTPNETLAAGKSKIIFHAKRPQKGFIVSSYVSVNDPDAELEIFSDTYSVKASFSAVNTLGLIQPAMQGAQIEYLAKYDTVNNIYTMVWAPAIPTPFNREVRFTAYAPKTAAVTLRGFFICWIEITDENIFRKSLFAALNGFTIKGGELKPLDGLENILKTRWEL